MSILSKLDLFSSFSSAFNFIVLMFLVLVILGILVLIVYTQIKNIIFRKKAVPVKVKVKEVKRKESYDKTLRGYDVTFEFELNGELREETIFSSKNFKINSIREGLYLESKKKHLLSVEDQGFYVNKGAGFFGITFAVYVLFLVTCVILNLAKFIIYGSLVYLLLLFCGLYIRGVLLGKKKDINNKNDAIYYDKSHYDEYSTVDSTLVRYIPKYKKPKKAKKGIGSLLFQGIFIGLGGIVTLIGIFNAFGTLQVKFNYIETVGKISEIYTYESSSDGETVSLVGVIYTYEVDGNKYTLDYKTGTGEEVYFKNVGDKEKLYYSKEKPSNSIPKSALGNALGWMIVGPLFLYIGISNFIEESKKKRLYNMYIKLSEEN